MNIDLSGMPPSEAAIQAAATAAAQRLRAAQWLEGLVLWLFFTLGILVIGVIGVALDLYAFPEVESPIFPFALVGGFAVVGMLVALGHNPARAEYAAQATLALMPILPSDCPEALALCRADPVLATYHGHVAEMNRQLIAGELAAMRAWNATRATVKRQLRQNALRVCRRNPPVNPT